MPHEISSVLDQFAEDISELRRLQEAAKHAAPLTQPVGQPNTEQLVSIEKRLTAIEALDHSDKI